MPESQTTVNINGEHLELVNAVRDKVQEVTGVRPGKTDVVRGAVREFAKSHGVEVDE